MILRSPKFLAEEHLERYVEKQIWIICTLMQYMYMYVQNIERHYVYRKFCPGKYEITKNKALSIQKGIDWYYYYFILFLIVYPFYLPFTNPSTNVKIKYLKKIMFSGCDVQREVNQKYLCNENVKEDSPFREA